MTVVPQDIRNAYPEFGGLADLQIQVVLDRAKYFIDPNVWYQIQIGDGFSDQAIQAWTAHNLYARWQVQLATTANLKNLDQDKPIPDLVQPKTSTDYTTTIYGQQFLQLQAMLPRLGSFVAGGY